LSPRDEHSSPWGLQPDGITEPLGPTSSLGSYFAPRDEIKKLASCTKFRPSQGNLPMYAWAKKWNMFASMFSLLVDGPVVFVKRSCVTAMYVGTLWSTALLQSLRNENYFVI
jgi:hypothetical protein